MYVTQDDEWTDWIEHDGGDCPDCGGPLNYAGGGRWDCPRCSGF